MLVGLLSLAVMPAAIAGTRWSHAYGLLHAGFAIPVGLALGALAISLARRARRTSERTLGRAGGERAAALGRGLGLTGFLVAVTAAMSLGVYVVLAYVAD